jgi:hypothetical protein
MVQRLAVIPVFMVLKTRGTMALPQTLTDKQLKESFDREGEVHSITGHQGPRGGLEV